mgnify:FL=1
MTHLRVSAAISSFAALLVTTLPGGAAGEPTAGELLFALHVKEIIAEKCIACHSSDEDKKLKGGLEMSTRKLLLKGGESGEVLIPGNAKESLLYIATTWEDEDYEMPPKEADRLSEEQQWKIRDWINAGAPWPNAKRVRELQNKLDRKSVV